MKTRINLTHYIVNWCVDGHDDIRRTTMDKKETAEKFAMNLVAANKTFHGACGITEQTGVITKDDDGSWISWTDSQTWECDGKTIYEI